MTDDTTTTDTTDLVADVLEETDAPKSTAVCSECGELFVQAPGERASASFKVAAHRYNKHGIRGDGRKTAPKNEPNADDLAARPIVATVRSIGSAAGSSGRTPSEDDLAKALGRGLGLSTMAAASYVVENDPNIPEGAQGERQRDALVDYLSLSDKAARDLMHPIARAIAPTAINRRFGRSVVDNVDVVGSVAELAILAQHWRKYMRIRAQGDAIAAAVRAEQSAPVSDAAAAAMVPPGMTPAEAAEVFTPPPFTRDAASPAPSSGVVLTPDMVQALQNGRR